MFGYLGAQGMVLAAALKERVEHTGDCRLPYGWKHERLAGISALLIRSIIRVSYMPLTTVW